MLRELEKSAEQRREAPVERAPAAPPCAMVIFGATGDLTKRLIMPALYHLVRAKRLSDAFRLIGVSQTAQSLDDWRKSLTEAMKQDVKQKGEAEIARIDESTWRWLGERMDYVQANLNAPEGFRRLAETLDRLDKKSGTRGNVLFYLAVPDSLFAKAVDGLDAVGLLTEKDGRWRRVVIEKPFGHDLASAKALNADLLKHLEERQIFRIDHFLGKETVQNIMALRFANGLFEPIWGREHIDHVQITAAETVGVERRGNFYDKTGALRDMTPNHLFQLLSMTAMEPPISFEAEAVRAKKAEVIEAIRPLDADDALKDAVRGQYAAGVVQGAEARAYREEPDVASNSNTETFIACKLMIDNWRWAGVPFYLRTGKHLARRRTEIAIRFHQAPFALFRGCDVARMHPNWMILRIQPDEGIALEFAAKQPGPRVRLSTVSMDFAYSSYFKAVPDTGYETLLYDCMIGDATLFQRADNIEAGWRAVQPILDVWADYPPCSFPNYAAGSSGPTAADALLARDGRAWRPLE